MGRFIQAPQPKAEFLVKNYNATEILRPENLDIFDNGKVLVMWGHTGDFEVLIWLFNESEKHYYDTPEDGLPRRYFVMDLEIVKILVRSDEVLDPNTVKAMVYNY